MNQALSIIVAYSQGSRAIGLNGKIPWHHKEDMAHFKRMTMGHAIIMGRKTWESIGSKPLPGRLNIVLTRNHDTAWAVEGAEVFTTLEGAIQRARDSGDECPTIIGGEQIYRLALPLATVIHATEVHGWHDGDAHFPELRFYEWAMMSTQHSAASPLTFRTFSRINQ